MQTGRVNSKETPHRLKTQRSSNPFNTVLEASLNCIQQNHEESARRPDSETSMRHQEKRSLDKEVSCESPAVGSELMEERRDTTTEMMSGSPDHNRMSSVSNTGTLSNLVLNKKHSATRPDDEDLAKRYRELAALPSGTDFGAPTFAERVFQIKSGKQLEILQKNKNKSAALAGGPSPKMSRVQMSGLTDQDSFLASSAMTSYNQFKMQTLVVNMPEPLNSGTFNLKDQKFVGNSKLNQLQRQLETKRGLQEFSPRTSKPPVIKHLDQQKFQTIATRHFNDQVFTAQQWGRSGVPLKQDSLSTNSAGWEPIAPSFAVARSQLRSQNVRARTLTKMKAMLR